MKMNLVHFGDGPAACLLEVSRKKIACTGDSIEDEAASKMLTDSYVDDNFSREEPEAFEPMVGSRLPNGEYDGTVSKILEK